ncbi:deoxyribose-phosphate aldolase [Flavobacteriaceae bacterium F89]|uniref:Deoxyribose-phosphate aldolase n=1 Tax=Cerina litoralis TaxID=2874477 RepID=A0AAE3JNN1_9FLAO|nr:DUF6503 family protein [Cerina litoralis]MCG2460066.1 deoxyribose-phosphate aldolase [Cerina litoralis]
MKKAFFLLSIITICSCGGKMDSTIEAQRIVDNSIAVSGGELYKTSNVSFNFRSMKYVLQIIEGQRVMKRIFGADSSQMIDMVGPNGFQRFLKGGLVHVSDSMANVYSNSINSVHYFAYLPYGLNDPAVNKKLLGEIKLEGTEYYKVKVTFDKEGGGDDYEDTFIYWFNKKNYKPDYLAYEFHTDGGGMRFRKAYNERYVNGIRFVDYDNYKTVGGNASILKIDSLFLQNKLKPLSKIELKNIKVTRP